MILVMRKSVKTPESPLRLPHGIVIAALLAIPFLFWRPHLFFIVDDWTALDQMVRFPFWQYLNLTDNEQWFPFFHLIYYLLIKISGERYGVLLFVNCLGTGLNACLVYLFYRRHLSDGKAWVLSLIYAALVVHAATLYHAYNLCYLLAFGFFMAAMLLADGYLTAPSGARLAGMGICALLALLSHSFAIMTLPAILLYGLLLKGETKGRFRPLVLVIGLVFAVFGAGYAYFAGISAASNTRPVLQLPGPGYLLYILYGGLFQPFYLLLGGSYPVRILLILPLSRLLGPVEYLKSIVTALLAAAVTLPLIFCRGDSRTKRLALWAMFTNLLLFLLVGLVRYQMSILQSASIRYGVFTMMGTLLLLGLAWQTLSRLQPQRLWFRLLPIAMLVWIISSQANSHPQVRDYYLNLAQATHSAYLKLDRPRQESPASEPAEAGQQLFCPEHVLYITRSQALAIQRFLKGLPPDK